MRKLPISSEHALKMGLIGKTKQKATDWKQPPIQTTFNASIATNVLWVTIDATGWVVGEQVWNQISKSAQPPEFPLIIPLSDSQPSVILSFGLYYLNENNSGRWEIQQAGPHWGSVAHVSLSGKSKQHAPSFCAKKNNRDESHTSSAGNLFSIYAIHREDIQRLSILEESKL